MADTAEIFISVHFQNPYSHNTYSELYLLQYM